jgi:branched-chain amino acid transport system permease protein
MLGALTTWSLYELLGINPLIALIICGPIAFGLGYLIHRFLFKRLHRMSPTQGAFESSSMLASFGLLFIIQNIASIAWKTDIRQYSYLAVPVTLAGSKFGANRLVTLGFAVAIGVAFYIFVTRTRLGKAIRAAAQDPAAAGLMGVDINKVLALCFGLGAALAAIAGVLYSMWHPVHVLMGFPLCIVAIIIVALGGLGSIPGSFVGGFILGIIGHLVTYINPALAIVAYYLIFVGLLLVRPTGIMGK